MWGKAIAQVGGIILVLVWANFALWRRMRQEVGRDEALEFLGEATVLAAGGSVILGKWIGAWGWGATAGVVAALVRYYLRRVGDVWELADAIGPVWLWATGLWSWVGGAWLAGAIYVVGLVPVTWVARSFRRFTWYKSGKPGIIGSCSLAWWAMAQTAVAMVEGHQLYWAGLHPVQWIAAASLVVCGVMIYLRSGLRWGEAIWRRTTSFYRDRIRRRG